MHLGKKQATFPAPAGWNKTCHDWVVIACLSCFRTISVLIATRLKHIKLYEWRGEEFLMSTHNYSFGIEVVRSYFIYTLIYLFIYLHAYWKKFAVFAKPCNNASTHIYTASLPLSQTFTLHLWGKQDIWTFYSNGLALFA